MASREKPSMTAAEVQAFLAEPLPLGQVRTTDCRICGAVTYIRFGGDDLGSGDPIKHIQYHRERGEA